jgi:hypothetical protein
MHDGLTRIFILIRDSETSDRRGHCYGDPRGHRCGEPQACSRKGLLATRIGRSEFLRFLGGLAALRASRPPVSLVCLFGWRFRTVDAFPPERISDLQFARSGARADGDDRLKPLSYPPRFTNMAPLLCGAYVGYRYRSNTTAPPTWSLEPRLPLWLSLWPTGTRLTPSRRFIAGIQLYLFRRLAAWSVRWIVAVEPSRLHLSPVLASRK